MYIRGMTPWNWPRQFQLYESDSCIKGFVLNAVGRGVDPAAS